MGGSSTAPTCLPHSSPIRNSFAVHLLAMYDIDKRMRTRLSPPYPRWFVGVLSHFNYHYPQKCGEKVHEESEHFPPLEGVCLYLRITQCMVNQYVKESKGWYSTGRRGLTPSIAMTELLRLNMAHSSPHVIFQADIIV